MVPSFGFGALALWFRLTGSKVEGFGSSTIRNAAPSEKNGQDEEGPPLASS